MSDTATLEALGFTKDEIAERIIDRAVQQLLKAEDYDEDGHSYGVPSTFATAIDKAIRQKLDEAVVKAGDEVIAPKIAELIDGHVMVRTNEWGEKKGEPVSFTEYLVQRADAYMVEEVSFDGKSKAQSDSYSFRKFGTRVAYMIDKHLAFHIERAMAAAVGNAHSTIAASLNDAVKIAIGNLQVHVKTEVKTK